MLAVIIRVELGKSGEAVIVAPVLVVAGDLFGQTPVAQQGQGGNIGHCGKSWCGTNDPTGASILY